jgi:hypothetical protein
MEEELARRKAERIAKAKANRKQKEADLILELGGTKIAKQEEMIAVMGLIKPIPEEEAKIMRVLRDIPADEAVIKP